MSMPNEELTIGEIMRRELALVGNDPYKAAAKVLRKYPSDLLVSLFEEELQRLLAQEGRAILHQRRRGFRKRIRRAGTGPRSIVGTGFFTTTYEVNGQYIMAADLTVPDIDWLIDSYREQAEILTVQGDWWLEVRKLAVKHKAKTLDDLRQKNIELPIMPEVGV